MHQPVSAILLAAGRSTRMGTCKQLLPLQGEPAVARTARTLLEGGVSQVVVVVGNPAVAAAVSHLPVDVVYVRNPNGEMSDSTRTGIRMVHPAATAVMIALADQPLLRPDTVEMLIGRHRRNAEKIYIPVCNGRRGHPPLFPRAILRRLVQPLTLRDLLDRHADRVEVVQVNDAGAVHDMDTPRDYAALVRNSSEVHDQ